RVLERAGFAVLATADWAAARRRFDALKADLVICDLDVPGQGGGPAVLDIPSAAPAARILALSPKHRTSPSALPRDVMEVLGKPFTPSELLATVRRCLARPPRDIG